MPTTDETCTWTENVSDGSWSTGCGEDFMLNDGTPAENHMRYCCYCGKPIVEQPYVEEEDDD